MRRFFSEEIKKGAKHAELTGQEFHHLKKVLRLGVGNEVLLLNGKGVEFLGVVESLGKDSARIKIKETKPSIAESPLDITLLQAFLKGDKPEFIVHKAVELGVKEIVFYPAKRTVAKIAGGRPTSSDVGRPAPDYKNKDIRKRSLRLRAVAIEALKQSGRGVLPDISFMEFREAIKGWKDRQRIILYEEEKTKCLRDAIKVSAGPTHPSGGFPACPTGALNRQIAIAVMVGPEGGFSPDEIKEAEKEGFISASLGLRILKAETAAIAVMAILQYESGDVG